jgi:hypothetical protein
MTEAIAAPPADDGVTVPVAPHDASPAGIPTDDGVVVPLEPKPAPSMPQPGVPTSDGKEHPLDVG